MELLKERILKDGIVKPGNVLKVDSFLNHQMDIPFINELGKEFKRIFADAPINKILTIEASGIGIACIVAQYFNVPVEHYNYMAHYPHPGTYLAQHVKGRYQYVRIR